MYEVIWPSVSAMFSTPNIWYWLIRFVNMTAVICCRDMFCWQQYQQHPRQNFTIDILVGTCLIRYRAPPLPTKFVRMKQIISSIFSHWNTKSSNVFTTYYFNAEEENCSNRPKITIAPHSMSYYEYFCENACIMWPTASISSSASFTTEGEGGCFATKPSHSSRLAYLNTRSREYSSWSPERRTPTTSLTDSPIDFSDPQAWMFAYSWPFTNMSCAISPNTPCSCAKNSSMQALLTGDV